MTEERIAVLGVGYVGLPLALALATVVRPGLFSPAEKENGKAAWALGASFITEGAIPFAAADPLAWNATTQDVGTAATSWTVSAC